MKFRGGKLAYVVGSLVLWKNIGLLSIQHSFTRTLDKSIKAIIANEEIQLDVSKTESYLHKKEAKA